MSLDQDTGYIIDVPYTHGFYAMQAPLHLRYVAALHGYRTPDSRGGCEYCELGCGNGVTTNVLAAANPDGRFLGVDMNPAHIANARRVARDGGLTNARFLEAAFSDLLERDDLPEFDFITLHGVLAWIRPEQRRSLVDFIKDRLRPGGILYVSYNSFPGWAHTMPLRQLMIEQARWVRGDSLDKARAALDYVGRMAATNAGFFGGNPRLKNALKRLRTQSLHYVAHEYLNGEWQPLYSREAAELMAQARLGFVAEAEIRFNYPALVLGGKARGFLEGRYQSADFQTRMDYLIGTQFRRDVYIKGPQRELGPERRFAGFLFAAKPLAEGEEIAFPAVKMRPDAPRRALLQAAAGQALSMSELIALGAESGLEASAARIFVERMVAGGKIDILHTAPAEATEGWTLSAFNRRMLADGVAQRRPVALASPVSASGITLPLAQAFMVEGMVDYGVDAAPQRLWEDVSARGMKMVKDERQLQTRDEHLAFFRERIQQFLTDLIPRLRRLGVLT